MYYIGTWLLGAAAQKFVWCLLFPAFMHAASADDDSMLLIKVRWQMADGQMGVG